MPDLRHTTRNSGEKTYLLAAGVAVSAGDWVCLTTDQFVVLPDHADADRFLGEALADASNANGADGAASVMVRNRGERLSAQDGSLGQSEEGFEVEFVDRQTVAVIDSGIGGAYFLYYAADVPNYAYIRWDTVGA